MNSEKTRVSLLGRYASVASTGALLLGAACSVEAPEETTPNNPTPTAGAAGASTGTSGTNTGGAYSTAGSAGASTGTAGTAVSNGGNAPTAGSGTGGAAGGSGTGTGGSTAGTGAGGAPPNMPQVTPCATSVLSKCTGSPLACHFGGEPGNYEVTVQLSGAGKTEVEAEYYRRMLTQTTVAGDAKWFSFVTNVRVYEGEPLRPDQDGTTSKGIPGLDIYFRGSDPKPMSLCYAPIAKPLMLWLAGDSTVTDQESEAFSGWGQHLPQHFVSPVSVANYADSGESSGSVLNSAKLWGAIKGGWKAGDWVMLQVGHNDKTTAANTFKSNLQKMIADAKAANVHMVLVTPISRANGALASQHVNSVGANLPQIIRDLGKSESLPVIDLTVTTYEWLQTIKWQDYFANGTDATHTNQAGADIVSGFVRDAVRKQNLELAAYLR
ncbi:MAG TPA: SGNH/GDSL hydrolase family protein [Polyangiaceae bacterium]|jgi:lysophospholipase L1-like esterase|nr:SGNH/GDSL hydrolase family protein [Polyangiaceae bacterium]